MTYFDHAFERHVFFALFILPIFPVRGRGVCSMVNRETLSEHRSELGSDALPATTVDFSGI